MDGFIKIGTKLDTKSFDKEIEELEDKIRYLENRKRRFIADDDAQSLREVNAQLEKTKNKLIGLQQQQMKLGNTSKQSFLKMQDGMEGVIKKVVKWGLAIFSIRSAYSLVRRSISTLTQYDENLANQLQYISWTIAQAIAPVVSKIVDMAYLILQYVNQIVESLFGYELFKGPEEFEKSMKSASSSAKEIKKSLAGFDEKNVIAITQATSGGGATTSKKPVFKTEGMETPRWLKWILNNGDKVKLILEGIATAILTCKTNLDLLSGVGLFLVIDGIVRAVGDIKDYIDDPSWGNFSKILMDIAETLGGIALIFRGSQLGTISFYLLIIVGVIQRIGEWINNIKNNLKDPSFKNFFTMVSNGITILGPFGAVISLIVHLISNLKDAFKTARQELEKLAQTWENFKNKADIKLGFSEKASNLGQALGSALKKKLGLAKGTILNNPGQGVPLSNVVAGEQGREALIPLSDSQLLEELGSTIGRYVSINLTNITELDGSTIARKVSKINQENNFATNR